MSYKWCNEKKLDLLNVSGNDSILYFGIENESVEVFLNNNDISKVVFKAPGTETIILREDSHHIIVGEGNTERDVFHFLKPNGPSKYLRLGITKHKGIGTWSSLPHNFELNTEAGFEEIFFYLLQGGNERAIQVGEGIWFNEQKVESSWFVYDHTFSCIPMGYHPTVGEPGVSVSYVWAYLAKFPHWEKI